MLAGQVGVDMAIYLMAWLKGEGPSVSTMDSTKSLGNSLWPGQGAGSSPGGAGYGNGLRHLSQVWRCWVASFLADDHWEGQSPIKGP